MLILGRATGQTIVVGDGEITIKVLSAENGRARLGFMASENIEINRSEIYARKKQDGYFDKGCESAS